MPFKQAIEIGSKPTSDPNQNLNMYKSLKRLQIYLPASNQIPALMHNKHVLENETLRQVQCQWLFVVEMLVWIKKCRQYKSPLHNDNHAKSVEPLDQQSAPPKVKASATPQNLLQHIASLFMMNSMICNIMFQWLAGLNPCHPKPCLVSMFAQQLAKHLFWIYFIVLLGQSPAVMLDLDVETSPLETRNYSGY